jgi:peptidoglycan-N-acetylglucosamine deacetylase
MIFRAIIVALVLMLVVSSEPSSVLAASPAACGGGFVALTFDDGPTPDTNAMLEALKLHNLKATFFLIGRNVAMYPDIARSIVNEGHQIGNHSWDHQDLRLMTDEALDRQFRSTNEIIEQVTGVRPSFARPPYGSTNAKVQSAMSRNGLREVIWSQDSRDWTGATPDAIVNQLSLVPQGGTFMLHDRLPNALAAIPWISSYLNSHWKASAICAGRLEATNNAQPVLGWPGVVYFASAVQ